MGLFEKVLSLSEDHGAPHEWLVDGLVEQFVSQEQAEADHWSVEQDWFRPSSLTYKWSSGMCPRYWWYVLHQTPRVVTNDAEFTARMGHGTKRHEVLQAALEKLPQCVELERKLELEGGPTVRGSCDAVLSVDGEIVILEIKTTQAAHWTRRQIEGPPHYNKLQLGLYMLMAGAESGILFIENNDTRQVLVFDVTMDEVRQDLDDLLEWMRLVEPVARGDARPRRVFTKSSYNCKGCPFKQRCWDDPDGTVELPVNPAMEAG